MILRIICYVIRSVCITTDYIFPANFIEDMPTMHNKEHSIYLHTGDTKKVQKKDLLRGSH